MSTKTNLRAAIVCVDYWDILSVTLPYNRHHFAEVLIVTTPQDEVTRYMAAQQDCQVVTTDLFTKDGASFNKWRALEHGLDTFGRHGFICLMDADILWPKILLSGYDFQRGCLYTPLRRMCPWPVVGYAQGEVPPEQKWGQYPIHRNVSEWAGYTQIFHADDPVLGQPPWHQIDFKHAGAADSFFQRKWAKDNKLRPIWNCLHLGEAGTNWYGRASPYGDGKVPVGSDELKRKVANLWQGRHERRMRGGDEFGSERINPT